MILNNLLNPFEKYLNHILSSDQEKFQELQKLSGQIIQIILLPMQFTLYLSINDEIHLSSRSDQNANVIVSGSPIALLQALNQKGMSLSEQVSITGDLHVIQTFKNILASIDLDWEELFSRVLGDTASHLLFKNFRKFKDFHTKTLNSIARSSKEYLQEEIKFLPTRCELELFFNDVDVIRNDIERLQARIDLLKQS